MFDGTTRRGSTRSLRIALGAGVAALAVLGGAAGCGEPAPSAPARDAAVPAGPLETRFYDFRVGTKWTFDAKFNGDPRTCVFTVAERQGDRTSVEYDIYAPPDPGATASMDEVWYLEDGYVLWGSLDDGKASPWWRVFRVGAKPGDTWEGPAGKGRASFVGVEEVVVPAGRYPGSLHVRLTDEDGKTHDFFYASGVGLVRWETTGPRGSALLTLRTFVPGN